MKNMRLFLFAFFLFAFSIGFAQNSDRTLEMGFEIKLKDPTADISKYTKAASAYGYFDQFRFMDKRREMSFEDGKAVIILYSANEMLANTQKQVSPLTIKNGAAYEQFTLALWVDGSNVKPMPTGSWLQNK